MSEPRSTTREPVASVHRGAPGRRYRLAVLNTHPIQYFAPLYRRLAGHPEIDLTVYFCSLQGAMGYVDSGFGKVVEWDVPLLDGYQHKLLPNLRPGGEVGGFLSLINPAIVAELWRSRYDALWLHGYNYLTHCLAVPAARLAGSEVFYRTESSLLYDSRVRRSPLVRLLKPALLRLLFSQIRSFLAIGTVNVEFYRHHGVPDDRIFHVPYSVDNDYFAERSARHRPERERIRAQLGIAPDAVTFLFPAKMISLKRPLEVLQAYERVPAANKALLMVGDGPLRDEAEAYTHRRELKGVRFLGFVNQSELPRMYAASDVLVRPDGVSKGDWGLTVNEAMASGLAVIATEAIGASIDLVRNGDNGFMVRFGDLEELAAAMSRAAADPERCVRMGRRSSEIIATWGVEQCVDGVLEALHSLLLSTEAEP
jgi:glycosyltransferase involved in cell wall biosynthesis